MFNLSSRLAQAHEASNPAKHLDNEQQLAGRQSEKAFVDLILKHNIAYSSDIFRNIRVPDNFQTHKHEIDVVFLTDEGLNVVEIKNLGGELFCGGDDQEYWEQKRRAKNSTFIQLSHANPVNLIQKKSNLLRTHLMKGGICIHERNIISKVILMNSGCKVSESISTNPCVVTHEKLDEYFKSFDKTLSSKLVNPLIPSIISGSLSYTQMGQCRIALNQIGTWDIVELNGGRLLIGDYKGCPELNFSRSDVEKIVFTHQRNATLSNMWAVLGYEPTTTVTMHKRNATGWFGPTIFGTVIVPFSKDIQFQVAGENVFSKIPVNEIKYVILSK